jgi:hypothetical protein
MRTLEQAHRKWGLSVTKSLKLEKALGTFLRILFEFTSKGKEQ